MELAGEQRQSRERILLKVRFVEELMDDIQADLRPVGSVERRRQEMFLQIAETQVSKELRTI